MKSDLIKAFGRDWRILAVAAGLSFAFVAFVSFIEKPAEGVTSAAVSTEPIETLIPKGFLLIPIEVQNYESLDSLLGKFGIVDLFSSDGKSGKLVARNVRILRAPQNPSRFAVLAREGDAPRILARQGQFHVALKSKTATNGTQIVTDSARGRRIHFDE